MISFTLESEYFGHLNQMMAWSNELNPTFFYFIDDFLHYITDLGKGFFCGGI
jgi:hypothetical protein